MQHKVLIIDTSVMLVWLGLEEYTGKGNCLTYKEIDSHIQEEIRRGTQMVMPITTVIETGNFIAKGDEGVRQRVGHAFADKIIDSADERSPWAVFSNQGELWNGEKLKELAQRWRDIVATKRHSFGDAAIVDVVQYFKDKGCDVEVYTGDELLKGLVESVTRRTPERIPRRRQQQ